MGGRVAAPAISSITAPFDGIGDSVTTGDAAYIIGQAPFAARKTRPGPLSRRDADREPRRHHHPRAGGDRGRRHPRLRGHSGHARAARSLRLSGAGPSPITSTTPARSGPRLVAALDEGRSVALVSDAGTPLVSTRLSPRRFGARSRSPSLSHSRRLRSPGGADGFRSADRQLLLRRLPAGEGRRPPVAPRGAGGNSRQPDHLRIAAPAGRQPRGDGRDPRAGPAGGRRPRDHQGVRGDAPRHAGGLAAAYAGEDTPRGEIVVCVGPPIEREASALDIDALLGRSPARCPPRRPPARRRG